jgi:hypothetical protein
MQTVTYNQIQELVASLPRTQLSRAYELLRDLLPETPQSSSPQREFMRLPLNERQHLLSDQAAELVEHYTHTHEDRELWQGGDIEDY